MTDLRSASITAILLSSGIYLAYSALRRRRTAPGPSRLPLLGNLLQIPSQLQFLQYTEWAKTYGPIFSLDVPGQHIVVVNTFEVAADLFERRSNVYNDRPNLVMAHEILSDGILLVTMKSGDLWRRMRRAIHGSYNPRVVERYQSLQVEAAALATLRTIANPSTWEKNFEVTAASSLASSVYGWPPLDTESYLVRFARDMVVRVAGAGIPGAYLVNSFPIMKYIPASLARWKREGLNWHKEKSAVLEQFSSDSSKRAHRDKEKSQGDLVSDLLASEDRHRLSKKESAWLSGMLILGGADTTAAALNSCALAMLHYPDVLNKAQEELDKVVGRERAPTPEDKNDLPYIQAIARELLRWRPPVPASMPHMSTEDGWYKGYFIPKGALIIGNIWAMNRDPSIYPDFETFRPERFLDSSGKLKAAAPDTHHMGHLSYGFGKRICPGMHFAEQNFFIAIATMLWAFNIRPPYDEEGNAMLPDRNEWVDDVIVVRPASFKCDFSPRFPGVQEILENMITTTN